ncbi:hypothetical protein C6Y14_12685 [Streptomyces dioscori]|uniref:Uncharacterized protein n=1 Tax=Streptomyces dioscori TaxID=2109333 RepID=A0A2P8Q9U4_9ACTN|nr:hypothetical protein C6Y14_12685 [Streptomyces dioscori]
MRRGDGADGAGAGGGAGFGTGSGCGFGTGFGTGRGAGAGGRSLTVRERAATGPVPRAPQALRTLRAPQPMWKLSP